MFLPCPRVDDGGPIVTTWLRDALASAAMRIAGVRLRPSYARLLAQVVGDAGFPGTAAKIGEAIQLQVVDPPLTLADHEAILAALDAHCPPGLYRLQQELREDHLRRGP